MSFLKPSMGAAGAADGPNGLASGLGHLIGVDPSQISSNVGRFGTAMNGIATAGGATPGYVPQPQVGPQPVSNHLQLLNPDTLHSVLQRFKGPGAAQQFGLPSDNPFSVGGQY